MTKVGIPSSRTPCLVQKLQLRDPGPQTKSHRRSNFLPKSASGISAHRVRWNEGGERLSFQFNFQAQQGTPRGQRTSFSIPMQENWKHFLHVEEYWPGGLHKRSLLPLTRSSSCADVPAPHGSGSHVAHRRLGRACYSPATALTAVYSTCIYYSVRILKIAVSSHHHGLKQKHKHPALTAALTIHNVPVSLERAFCYRNQRQSPAGQKSNKAVARRCFLQKNTWS